MDVKIKKCNSREWYSKYIGEVFTVEEVHSSNLNGAKFFVQIKDRRIRKFTNRDVMSVWISDVEII